MKLETRDKISRRIDKVDDFLERNPRFGTLCVLPTMLLVLPFYCLRAVSGGLKEWMSEVRLGFNTFRRLRQRKIK